MDKNQFIVGAKNGSSKNLKSFEFKIFTVPEELMILRE